MQQRQQRSAPTPPPLPPYLSYTQAQQDALKGSVDNLVKVLSTMAPDSGNPATGSSVMERAWANAKASGTEAKVK